MGKVGDSEGRRAVPSLSSREFHVPESAGYVTTVVDITSETMVRTRGGSPASSFLRCSLFSNSKKLPQGAYLDLPPPREWEAAAGHYSALFTAPSECGRLCPKSRIGVYVGSHIEEFKAGTTTAWEAQTALRGGSSGFKTGWKQVTRGLLFRPRRRERTWIWRASCP